MAHDGLQPGDQAPDFALPDPDGTLHCLADFAGRRLVLFFYPRADTPGCTTEAQDFSARKAAFESAGASVLGISADPPRKLAKFRERRALDVTLLSDESQAVLRAYRVWGQKSMYGKTFQGVLRTTFVIGPNRRIAAAWHGVKVAGHAETVLGYVHNHP